MTYVTGDRFKQVDRGDRSAGRPWLGHKFRRSDKLVHELRCWICGKWFNYELQDIPAMVAQGRWDFSKQRPKHCGNSHCVEWNRRHEVFMVRTQQEEAEYHHKLFLRLKKKGLVA